VLSQLRPHGPGERHAEIHAADRSTRSYPPCQLAPDPGSGLVQPGTDEIFALQSLWARHAFS